MTSAAGSQADSKTIDELHVGEACELTKLVSMEDIRKFAEVSGDFNPIHTDEEFAKRSQFGRCIAHGPVALGLAGGVIGTRLPGLGTIAISASIRHRAPIFAGDRVNTRVTISAVDLDRTRVTLAVIWKNQDGQLLGEGEVVVQPPLTRVTPGLGNSYPGGSQDD